MLALVSNNQLGRQRTQCLCMTLACMLVSAPSFAWCRHMASDPVATPPLATDPTIDDLPPLIQSSNRVLAAITSGSINQEVMVRQLDAYIEDVQNITFSANCLKHLLYEGEVQRGCTQEDTAMVNQKMLPYPTLPDRVSAKVVEIIKAEVSHL